MTNFTTEQSDAVDSTQQISRRRRRRTERKSAMSLVFLVGCIAIGHCFAFQLSNPSSRRAFVRLHATTGAEEDVSSSSSSSPVSPIQTYDRQAFEMQVGRAMDTLRDDYPDILVKDLGR